MLKTLLHKVPQIYTLMKVYVKVSTWFMVGSKVNNVLFLLPKRMKA